MSSSNMFTTHDGTHQSHCCPDHGCKYGDDDCPVAAGYIKPEGHPLECCEMDIESAIVRDLKEQLAKEQSAKFCAQSERNSAIRQIGVVELERDAARHELAELKAALRRQVKPWES